MMGLNMSQFGAKTDEIWGCCFSFTSENLAQQRLQGRIMSQSFENIHLRISKKVCWEKRNCFKPEDSLSWNGQSNKLCEENTVQQ